MGAAPFWLRVTKDRRLQQLVEDNELQVQGVREFADPGSRCAQRLALLSDAAAMGGDAIAETALNASACPAPN